MEMAGYGELVHKPVLASKFFLTYDPLATAIADSKHNTNIPTLHSIGTRPSKRTQ